MSNIDLKGLQQNYNLTHEQIRTLDNIDGNEDGHLNINISGNTLNSIFSALERQQKWDNIKQSNSLQDMQIPDEQFNKICELLTTPGVDFDDLLEKVNDSNNGNINDTLKNPKQDEEKNPNKPSLGL